MPVVTPTPIQEIKMKITPDIMKKERERLLNKQYENYLKRRPAIADMILREESIRAAELADEVGITGG